MKPFKQDTAEAIEFQSKQILRIKKEENVKIKF